MKKEAEKIELHRSWKKKYLKHNKMGQALSSFVSCCCTEPARDTPYVDKYHAMGSNEDEGSWKEKVKTNEKKVIFAVDPKFSEEEIAKERSNILTNIE